jgi:hypothetical protein
MASQSICSALAQCGVAKIFSHKTFDTSATNRIHGSPLYTYPTAFKLLALYFHILHAMLFAAPSLLFYLQFLLYILHPSIAQDGSIHLSVWIYFPLSFACPRSYVRCFGHVSCINTIFLSCISHFVYLSLYKCFLFLSCGLRIRLDVLVIFVYGHSFLFLQGLKVMSDTPVINLYENDFLFIRVGWDILVISLC